MGRLQKAVHPYTFRAKLLASLLACCLLASVVALLLAYCFSHMSIKEELEQAEHTMAIYLLEMDQKTELTVEQIISIAQQDDLLVSILPAAEWQLDSRILDTLEDQLLYVEHNKVYELPATYVKTSGTILKITPARDYNLFLIALVRILFAPASFVPVFVALIVLAAIRASRPVASMTQAFTRIQEGDFTVRLPEDQPGEMGQMMRSFNGMAEALGRTAYLQKDFISSISHEFRTPIASIKGYAHLLQMQGVDDAQRQEYVGYIAQESDRLSRLSETLLRLSALEQQTGPASVSSFRLDEQVRQVILRLEPAWSAKEIDWQLELNDVTIESDEALLYHVWVNLLQNAVKFSQAGSSIEVQVYATDMAEIVVRDHGEGMDEQTLERIFDRFYQADRSRSREGVGLGLSLVKRILDMLGGTVKVTSKLGEGSTFRVRLPLRPLRAGNGGNEKS